MAIIKCSECGKKISDKATKCPSCGAPVDKKTNESAIWGFSLSIVSIFLNIVAILSLAFSDYITRTYRKRKRIRYSRSYNQYINGFKSSY